MSLNSIKTTAGRISNLNVSSGAKLESLEISGGTIVNLNIGGAGSYIRSISGTNGTNGTITNLTLGDANNNTPLLSPNIDAKVTNLKINNFGITVNSTANDWNIPKQDGQRISLADGGTTNLSVAQKGITINIGTNVSKGEVYEVENLVVAGTTSKGTNIAQSHITGGRGTQLIWATSTKSRKQGFMLEADGSDAYITDVYRAIALSYMRRNAMTQNILDTMTTKTFHSDNYYNQEVELRLL